MTTRADADQPSVETRPVVIAAGVVGVITLTLTMTFAVAGNNAAFFQAYLAAYTFWLGLGLGSLGVALIQFLTGGSWGLVTRRIFEAAATTLPLMAVLFVPLLFGLPHLYAWARPDEVARDPVLLHKSAYLNVPFFVLRTVAYLAVWTVMTLVLRRWSIREDVLPASSLSMRRLQRFSTAAVLLLVITCTFAAIDWLMSLDADWYSTMYPPMVGAGFLVLALAFSIVVLVALARRSALADSLSPGVWNDLGSLLLAFLMLWAYMAYFQYLLIWAGNLSDEIPWYLRRVDGGWRSVALALGSLGFGVPFVCLLFRPLKRHAGTLASIAGFVVIMRAIDVFWLVEPPLQPGGPALNWLFFSALIGIGGLWLAVFAWQLGRHPLLAPNDPRLRQALEAARGSA